jgi:hypothetical protein
LPEFINVSQYVAGTLGGGLAFGRKTHAPRAAIHQHDPQPIFHQGQPLANGCLGHAQLDGGRRQAGAAGQYGKEPKVSCLEWTVHSNFLLIVNFELTVI